MYLLMTVPGRPVSMDGHRNSNVVADFNQNTDRLRPAVVAEQETAPPRLVTEADSSRLASLIQGGSK